MKKFVFAAAYHSWRWSLRLVILVLILSILLLALAWLLLPQVGIYRAELERAIAEQLRVPVHIEQLQAGWQGWNPVLRVQGFSLHHPADDSVITRFDRAVVLLDLVQSLLNGRPQLDNVRLEVSTLMLAQGVDRRLRILPGTREQAILVSLDEALSWLSRVDALEILVDEIRLRSADPGLAPLSLSDLRLRIHKQAATDQVVLAFDLPAAPARRLQATMVLEDKDNLQGRLVGLRVQDLAALLVYWLSPAQRELLIGLEPTGELSEAVFSADLGEGYYHLVSEFKGLRGQTWRRIPGIDSLAGRIMLDQDGGRLDLDSHDVQIDAAALLRQPVSLATLSGSLRWRHEASGLHLQTTGIELLNDDFGAHLSGELGLLKDGPDLDLSIDFRDIDVGRIPAYLPAAVMKPKLLAWMDQALLGGQVANGTLVFRGRPGDFPFSGGEGLLEARFPVTDGIFNYAKNWPPIDDFAAEVVFRNRSFAVDATAGRILGAELEQAQAHIEAMGKTPLTVTGRIQSAGQTILSFLQQSPLAKKTAGVVASLKIVGDNTLDLSLLVPFKGRPVVVEGGVDFAGGSVVLPKLGNLALERVDGRLLFTESSLAAEGVQLNIRGQPVRLGLKSRFGRDIPAETEIILDAELSPQELLGEQIDALAVYLNGRSRWRLLLKLLNDSSGKLKDRSLVLSSDLQGVAVDLPPPFGKTANQKRLLKLDIEPREDAALQVRLAYTDAVRAALALADFPAQPRFVRGELRINTGAAQLPETNGLNVSAHLPQLVFPFAETNTDTGNGGIPSWLNTVDLRVDDLRIHGRGFPGVQMDARRQDNAWLVNIGGATLQGRLYIPFVPSVSTPLQAEFQRLNLNQPTGGETLAEAADPRAIPPLHVAINELIVDGKPLGQLRLSAIPEVRGLSLVDMELRGTNYQISGSGHWRMGDSGGQHSGMQIELFSPQPGMALQQLGYDIGLEQGETRLKLVADWAASFNRFALDLLQGQLVIDIGKGRLTKLDPGLGRILGLLALERRLAFDFSDLTDAGLSFDSIKGNVRFADGQAVTDDLVLLGPSAQVNTKGRLGLKTKDIDQIITVTPQIGSSLGIAGVIAGGPAVGAALFFADKLLPGGVGQVTSVQYTVTGFWDNPRVERVIVNQQDMVNLPELRNR